MKNSSTNQTKKPNFFKSHPFFIAFALFFLVVIVVAILYLNHLSKTATLDLLVAPSTATVTIDGQTYKNNTYHFTPGTYEVKIEKDGFTSKTVTIELKANETTNLHTYLLGTDGSYSWYYSHQEDALLLSTIGDEEANTASKSYLEKYPITKDLPIIVAKYDEQYNYTEYRIDGGTYTDCSIEFCLQISDTTGASSSGSTSVINASLHPELIPATSNYSAALQQIRDRGYDPANYTILYKPTPIQPLN